jgi:hypothetical protein
MQAYSDPKRESLLYSLPDIEVFELTAVEAAEQEEELIWEYSKRPEFKLCYTNNRISNGRLFEYLTRD